MLCLEEKTCIVLIQHYQQPLSLLCSRNLVVYKIKSHNMYIVLLLNLLTLSINIDNNTKLVLLSPKYAFVGKDVDVFEHDKLSKFTKIHIKVTEEPFCCCSTFHGHNSVFNNKQGLQ